MVQQVAVATLCSEDKRKTELVSHWPPWSWIYKEELVDTGCQDGDLFPDYASG